MFKEVLTGRAFDIEGFNPNEIVHAHCDRRGVIEFSKRTFEGGMMRIGAAPATKLHHILSVIARHAYDKSEDGNPILLVPGIPEQDDDDKAYEALIAFKEALKLRMAP